MTYPQTQQMIDAQQKIAEWFGFKDFQSMQTSIHKEGGCIDEVIALEMSDLIDAYNDRPEQIF